MSDGFCTVVASYVGVGVGYRKKEVGLGEVRFFFYFTFILRLF